METLEHTNGNGSDLAKVNWRGAELIVNRDDSAFCNLLDTGKFTQVYKLAELFASSQLVPKHFQDQPADCFIGIQMAIRLGVDPFMFLQNTYIVYGRPGMEAKLAIALINSSGLFADSLDYEIQGENPSADGYRVRAVAVRKGTNKPIQGPWIDWKVVRAEGWDKKDGSKWKTIPGLMFQYRAATWFGRLHCPERLMGMQTVDELADVGAIPVVSTDVTPKGTAALADKLRKREVLPDTQLSEADAEKKLAEAAAYTKGIEEARKSGVAQAQASPTQDSQTADDPDAALKEKHEQRLISLFELAQDDKPYQEVIKRGIGRVALGKKLKDAPWRISDEDWKEIVLNVQERRGYFADPNAK